MNWLKRGPTFKKVLRGSDPVMSQLFSLAVWHLKKKKTDLVCYYGQVSPLGFIKSKITFLAWGLLCIHWNWSWSDLPRRSLSKLTLWMKKNYLFHLFFFNKNLTVVFLLGLLWRSVRLLCRSRGHWAVVPDLLNLVRECWWATLLCPRIKPNYMSKSFSFLFLISSSQI